MPRWANVVYLALFLDLFGFGMLIADIQFLAERLNMPGWMIGLAMGVTFVVQVPVSPLWGRLSDHTGRKPVLVVCTLLSALAMLVYGLAATPLVLIASRVIAGLGGANVAVAQAMLADVTDESQRSTAMGRIGAAITLGLVGGPVIGGLLAVSHGSPTVGFVACVASAIGALAVLALVPRTKPTRTKEETKTNGTLLNTHPQLRALVVLACVAWFALATLEGTFGRLIKHTLSFDQSHFGIVFGWESVVAFVVQGFLLAWIAKRANDQTLLRAGYLLQGIGLAAMPFTHHFFSPYWLAFLLLFGTLYSFGGAVANPTVNAMCSKAAPAERQGELFGVLQGARSVGFMVGPVIGGALFDLSHNAPYLLAGAVCLLAAFLVPRSD
jgi:MFS family permease